MGLFYVHERDLGGIGIVVLLLLAGFVLGGAHVAWWRPCCVLGIPVRGLELPLRALLRRRSQGPALVLPVRGPGHRGGSGARVGLAPVRGLGRQGPARV